MKFFLGMNGNNNNVPPVPDAAGFVRLFVFTLEFRHERFLSSKEFDKVEYQGMKLANLSKPFRCIRVPKSELVKGTIESVFRAFFGIPDGMIFTLHRSDLVANTLELSFHPFNSDSSVTGLSDLSVWCLSIFGDHKGKFDLFDDDFPEDKSGALLALCRELQESREAQEIHNDLLDNMVGNFPLAPPSPLAHRNWRACVKFLIRELGEAVNSKVQQKVQVCLICLLDPDVLKWIDNDCLLFAVTVRDRALLSILFELRTSPLFGYAAPNAQRVWDALRQERACISDMRSSSLFRVTNEDQINHFRLRNGFVVCFGNTSSGIYPSRSVSGKCAGLAFKHLLFEFDVADVEYMTDFSVFIKDFAGAKLDQFDQNHVAVVSVHASGWIINDLNGVQVIEVNQNQVVSMQVILNAIARRSGAGTVVCLADIDSQVSTLPKQFLDELPLPNVRFATVFATQRGRLTLNDTRMGGYFTLAWTAALERGMSLRELVTFINASDVMELNCRLEHSNNMDPNLFFF